MAHRSFRPTEPAQNCNPSCEEVRIPPPPHYYTYFSSQIPPPDNDRKTSNLFSSGNSSTVFIREPKANNLHRCDDNAFPSSMHLGNVLAIAKEATATAARKRSKQNDVRFSQTLNGTISVRWDKSIQAVGYIKCLDLAVRSGPSMLCRTTGNPINKN
jgi:hypothetical protein